MTAKSRGLSWAVLAGAGTVLVLVAPLAGRYARKLAFSLGPSRLAAGVFAGALLLGALAWALARFPRITALALAFVAFVQIAATGNLAAFSEAAALLGCVVLLGDAATRVVAGENPGARDWPVTLAVGAACASLLVLVLAETGALRPSVLGALAAAILAARWRRIAALASFRRKSPDGNGPPAPASLRAVWLALSVAALAVVWLRVLAPDVSWDALAYHLPEARDVAQRLRVDVVPDLFPQSLLWRIHETFLSLGFFLPQGERVVQFLNFAFGLAGIGASVLLARRVGSGASGPLVLLALTGFPVVLFQLHSSYADWPAATFVVAAAAEFAASRGHSRRAWLGAFLFGAGVAAKPFALCAAPALAVLFARRGHWRPGRIAAAIALSLLPVVPWMVWSARHSGSPLAPVISHSGNAVESLPGGRLASGPAGAPSRAPGDEADGEEKKSLGEFFRLPYDLTFHSSRFQGFRDGYFGLLALVLAVGVAGWKPVPALLFAFSAAAALLPWYFGPSPSVRYLFPIYPLYAVFMAVGISSGTGRFAGKAGLAAGAALGACVLALPVGFDPKPREIRAAFGQMSREQVLDAAIPSYRLWALVRREDRAVLIGEYDRFHCPASLAYRIKYIPVRYWGDDPALWKIGLRRYGITVVVISSSAKDHAGLIGDLVESGDLRLVAKNRGTALYRVAGPAGRSDGAVYNGSG
ncbi:MAG: hypothetical protein ACRD16_05990 [Thermoanaerobaculia bacterium]